MIEIDIKTNIMFDPKFVMLLIKYNEYELLISNTRANYSLMESKMRRNYSKIKRHVMEPMDIWEDCNTFIGNNPEFIEYYDNWYCNFNQK